MRGRRVRGCGENVLDNGIRYRVWCEAADRATLGSLLSHVVGRTGTKELPILVPTASSPVNYVHTLRSLRRALGRVFMADVAAEASSTAVDRRVLLRAGTAGVVESIYQAFSLFITYAKLWEKQQKSSEK